MKRSQLFVLVAFASLLLAIALSAAAVQAAPPPQGDGGTARTYWLLLDPSRPVEVTLPSLLAALAHLRARGDVLRFDQAPQDGVLRVIAGPGAAAKLRHLPGVAGLSDAPPASASASGESGQDARAPNAPSGKIGILATGAISGVVTAEGSGVPVSGIDVCAESDTDYSYTCGYTGSQGTYIIDLLAPDIYRVDFYDGTDNYAYEYYNNKPDWDTADLVTVTGGKTTRNINASLSSGGHITGVVTAQSSGLPLSGIEVWASSDDADAYAVTDEYGAYDIGGLGTGSYVVDFFDGSDTYIEEYYDDKPDWDTADPVAVTVGNFTRNINAALSGPGHITGVVTAAGSGALLPGIEVCANTDEGLGWSNCAITNSEGVYDIDGLGTANYTVQFVDNGGVYAGEYYNNKPDAGTADPVPVTVGQTTRNINAALAARGAIAGVVTAESGGAFLGGIEVCAYTNDLDWPGDAPCATTNGSGVYNLGGLESGSYRVEFRDAGAIYVTEYYNNSPRIEESNSVAVTGGATTNAINAALARPGHVTGTVTAAGSGTRLNGIRVCAIIGLGEYEQEYCANTGSGGGYDIGGLPGGMYRMWFSDTGQVYANEYYDDKPGEDEANWVAVTAGNSTRNINAALSAAGHITGVVTIAGSGDPLVDVEVCADDGIRDSCATTDSNGAYDIAGLGAGSYRVRFSDVDEWWYWGDYARQYYNNKSWETADPVVVTAGHITPNINAEMALGGHVTGWVVAEEGHLPLSDVEVCANDGVAPDGYCAYTDGMGDYDIGGLPAGTYHVEFTGNEMGDDEIYYGGECYDDKPCDAADWVTVTAGDSTDGIDAELSAGGRITGSVTAEGSGVPLADVEVCVEGWNCALTDGDGRYDLHYSLSTRSYKVEFADLRGVYAGEYYNNKPSASTADPVAVVGTQTTRDINAALSAGGHITGTVTISGSGAPLFDIKVTVYRSNGASWDKVDTTYTDSTGRYTIALPSGTYRVKFEDWWWGEYREVYYWNGVTPGGVTNVALTAPATIPNINAALALPVVNQSPVAVSDTYTTTRNAVLTVAAPGVLGNDTDADGDTLTATLASNVLTGMLNLRPNGSFIYTPTLNYTGQVTFTYRATDSLALSNPALVTITVQPSITTANLFIRKTSLRGEASITYTIVVTNAGPDAANGAQVSDPVPPGITGFTWNCVATGGASCDTGSGTGGLSETVGLPAGGIVTYTVVAGLADAEATIVNTATITAPAGVSDPVTVDNQSVDRSSGGGNPVYLPVIRK